MCSPGERHLLLPSRWQVLELGIAVAEWLGPQTHAIQVPSMPHPLASAHAMGRTEGLQSQEVQREGEVVSVLGCQGPLTGDGFRRWGSSDHLVLGPVCLLMETVESRWREQDARLFGCYG